jgi:hypothetical protein
MHWINKINWFGFFGVILSNLLGFRIGQSYVKNRTEQSHEYNEYLFYLGFYSCINWIYYAILISDIYVFASCITSLITIFGFIHVIFPGLQKNLPKLFVIEMSTITMILFWIVIISFNTILHIIPNNITIKILGIVCLINSLMTNLSPCLILYKVIVSQDSTLIYFPQALIGFVNLSLWTVYSILIGDIYQSLSNGISMIICFIQLIVYAYVKIIKNF